MQPTIREVLVKSLEALESSKYSKGGAVYDDLNQVLEQLGDESTYGDLLNDRLLA